MGKKLLPAGPPQTPVPLKQARCITRAAARGADNEACATPPDTCVPGPMMSGFLRPSDVGPRLEKPMISLALSAPRH